MKLTKKIIIASAVTAAAAGTLLLGGCSAQQLSPAAQKVMVTNQKAPSNCKFLGSVTSNQGNFFTGGFTSNQNLQEGSFNDLRNKAAAMGGNRVVTLMSTAASTGGGVNGTGAGSETNVALTGNVFKCPNQ